MEQAKANMRALDHLQKLLDEADVVVMHNQAADSMILTQHGINVPYNKLQDTMVMAHVLCQPSIGLKNLSASLLGVRMTELEEITGSFGTKAFTSPVNVAPEDIYKYACADADMTRRLYFVLKQMLDDEPTLQYVYEEVERPLFPVVVSMQEEGIHVDWNKLAELGRQAQEEADSIEAVLKECSGRTINLGSTQQLQAYIYGELGYPPQQSREGRPTLDAKAISKLRQTTGRRGDATTFLEGLAQWKKLRKFITTYGNGLPKLALADGKLHPTFKQCGAATGRFSSENPNAQNIPVRTELGHRVRACFVPPSLESRGMVVRSSLGLDGQGSKVEAEWVWLGCDYSQIELRALASIMHDRKLIQAFEDGLDIHTWSSERSGVPRYATKKITYGKAYGQGINGCYESYCNDCFDEGQQPVPYSQFKLFYDQHTRFLDVFPRYELHVKNSIRERGYVETLLGRRYVAEKQFGNEYRSALSHEPQGSAADLMKLALRPVWELCQAYGRDNVRLVATVHDEVCVYVKKHLAEEVGSQVKAIMEGVTTWAAPIVAEVKIGSNWQEAH